MKAIGQSLLGKKMREEKGVPAFERKLLSKCSEHIEWVILVFASVLGLAVRYPLRDILSSDAMGCLLPWYEDSVASGGLAGLSKQIGDYSIIYQLFVAVMTYIPVNPLYQYKFISVVFDYSLAAAVGVLVYDQTLAVAGDVAESDQYKREARCKGIIAYILTLFSVIVILNSAAWGQCDAIYSSFVIWAIVYLLRERYAKSFVFLGLAFSFKLQSAFILPFFLFVYFWRKRYSILYYVLIPIMMIVTSLPGLVMGRRIGDIFGIYGTLAGSFGQLWIKYPSFWAIFPDTEFGADDRFVDFHRYKNMALVLTVVFLAVIMLLLMFRKLRESKKNQLYIALLLTYTTVIFLPSMHERYGFIYEILSLAIVLIDKKTIPLAVVLQLITLYQYGGCLGFEMLPMSMQQLSMVNVFTYFAYVYVLFKNMEQLNDTEN